MASELRLMKTAVSLMERPGAQRIFSTGSLLLEPTSSASHWCSLDNYCVIHTCIMETAKCTQNSTESFKLEDLPFFVVYVLCNVKEGMENSISREEKDNSQRSSKVFRLTKNNIQ